MKRTLKNFRTALMLLLCGVSFLVMASTTKAQYMNTINGVTITQKITITGDQACVTYRNDSNVSRRVGLAVYQIDRTMFSLDFQTIFDSETISLAAGATQQVCVDQPPCASQYDAYFGEVVQSFADPTSDDYAFRLFDGILHGCFCPPDNPPGDGCTLTQGYWKNHEEDWCGGAAGLIIGGVQYSRARLLQILRTPVAGNCRIQVAHQYIAARLNMECRDAETSDSNFAQQLSYATGLFAGISPNVGGSIAPLSCNARTSQATETLTDFNEGRLGPPHCGDDDDN